MLCASFGLRWPYRCGTFTVRRVGLGDAQRIAARAYCTYAGNGAPLTHFDDEGRARMVDVGKKAMTTRVAEVECFLHVSAHVLRLLRDARLPKGDALTVAQVAGVMAAKRTAELVPLCHPLPLDCVRVHVMLPEGECAEGGAVRVHCEARATSRTGTEMEALTGAAVAALALYDMCKAADKEMRITDLRVVRKSGGKSDYPPPVDAPRVRDYDKSPLRPGETYAPTNMMYF